MYHRQLARVPMTEQGWIRSLPLRFKPMLKCILGDVLGLIVGSMLGLIVGDVLELIVGDICICVCIGKAGKCDTPVVWTIFGAVHGDRR